jgi:hypothetical protein
MEREAAKWRYGELHKARQFHDGTFTTWSADRTLATPYHFGDGVSIDVAAKDWSPDDDFLLARDPDDDFDEDASEGQQQ